MRNLLLQAAVLCFAMVNLVGLTSCGGGGSGPVSGASGASGGGTTGSGGATSPNSILSGKYAFSFTGTATNTGAPLFLAGSFTADGAGNITTGVEDINQIGLAPLRGLSISGTYSIGSDGRGTLNFTGGATQTFKIAIENGNHGQLIRFDSGAAGSGTFDLQTASAFSLASLHGSYAFEWNGSDPGGNPLSGIGAVSLSSGTGTGAGDVNDAGTYSQVTVSATLQSPDANGHGTASITYGSGGALSYAYDIISANRLLLIELDANAATVGEADLQSATFTTSSFSGNYAFFLNGISLGFGMVGQIVADGQGNISSSDSVENNFGALGAGSFPGTYTFSPTVQSVTVNGRFTMTATEPSTFTDTFVIYLVSPNQAFLMETDSDQLTFGQFVTQTGAPFGSSSLTGNYGVNFAGIDGNNVEADFVGQVDSGGAATLNSGTLDINDEDLMPPTIANSAISAGSYSITNSSTGHSTISFTVAGASFAFSFYFVSPSQIFMVQVDDQTFVTIGSAVNQPTIP